MIYILTTNIEIDLKDENKFLIKNPSDNEECEDIELFFFQKDSINGYIYFFDSPKFHNKSEILSKQETNGNFNFFKPNFIFPCHSIAKVFQDKLNTKIRQIKMIKLQENI